MSHRLWDTHSSAESTTAQPDVSRRSLKLSEPGRSQDPLAARFYRVQPPEQQPNQPLTSPQYSNFSDDTFHRFDTEAESGSSELSVNTQATSVASDVAVTKPTRPRAQPKYVRAAPLPPVKRVRIQPRPGLRAETSTRGSLQPQRHSVQTQMLTSARESGGNDDFDPYTEHEYRDKIDQLELDAENLKQTKKQLEKDLTEALKNVAAADETREALNQERASKELVIKDLKEQRKITDELRLNSGLQRGWLKSAEAERDNYKKVKDRLDAQLLKLTKDSESLVSSQKHQEDSLQKQVSTFERAADELENRVRDQQNEMKRLKDERDCLQTQLENHQEQTKELEKNQEIMNQEKAEFEERVAIHRKLVENWTAERRALVQEAEQLKHELQFLKDAQNAASMDSESLVSTNKTLDALVFEYENGKKDLLAEIAGAQDANVLIVHEKLAAESEAAKARVALNAAESKITELEALNQTLKAENEKANENRDQLSDTKSRVKELEEIQNSLTIQNDKKTEEIEKLHQENKSLQSHADSLQKKVDKYRDHRLVVLYEALEKSNEILTKEKTELEEKAKELQAEADKIPNLQAEADKVSSLQEEADKIPGLKEEADKVPGLKEEADKVPGLKEEADKVPGLQTEADKVPELTKELESSNGKIEELTKELEQSKTDCEVANTQVRELQAIVIRSQSDQKSRSASRSRNHTRNRSTSLLFIRNPGDRGRTVYIGSREVVTRADSVAARDRKTG